MSNSMSDAPQPTPPIAYELAWMNLIAFLHGSCDATQAVIDLAHVSEQTKRDGRVRLGTLATVLAQMRESIREARDRALEMDGGAP